LGADTVRFVFTRKAAGVQSVSGPDKFEALFP